MVDDTINQEPSETGSDNPETPPNDAGTGSVDSGASHNWAPGKADLPKRFVASIIDAVVAVLIGFIPWIGGLISGAYWVLRDGMEFEFMDHRSIGKKVMKLRPIRADGKEMDIEASIRRNWMFGLGGVIQFLLFIPIIGWLLIIPVSLLAMAIGLYELFKVVTDEEGRRFGDTFANTKVVEVDD